MRHLGRRLVSAWALPRPALHALRGRRDAGFAADAPTSPFAFPDFGRHDAGPARRHPQSRHDRRVGRSRHRCRGHDRAAAVVRTVPGPDRIQVGHAPLRTGVAARAVHLEGHVAAVRRFCHHALRLAGSGRQGAGRTRARSGSATPRPLSPFCLSAPARTSCRPRALRLPPI